MRSGAKGCWNATCRSGSTGRSWPLAATGPRGCRGRERGLGTPVAPKTGSRSWPNQPMANTPIAGLLRIGWDTVDQIVERVVADRLDY